MTHDEFISLVKCPQTVRTEQVAALKEMVEKYPYFVSPRLLLVYAYNHTNDVNSKAYLNESTIYCADRQWLYNYVYPEKIIAEEPIQHERVSKTSGNYFDMINAIESESGDSRQSLREMAQKLKEARAMVAKPEIVKTIKLTHQPVIEKEVVIQQDKPFLEVLEPAKGLISESELKKLISERKYAEAIETLKALNLNNPKKSIYFADQIRFLEKVILNQKK